MNHTQLNPSVKDDMSIAPNGDTGSVTSWFGLILALNAPWLIDKFVGLVKAIITEGNEVYIKKGDFEFKLGKNLFFSECFETNGKDKQD